jgi:hypothetical protein
LHPQQDLLSFSNIRMEKSRQSLWFLRPTLMGWVTVISSVVVINLATFFWPNHSFVIRREVFAVAVLVGAWFVGPVSGIVIALLPALLVRYCTSPLNEQALHWPGFAFELLFFGFWVLARAGVMCADDAFKEQCSK